MYDSVKNFNFNTESKFHKYMVPATRRLSDVMYKIYQGAKELFDKEINHKFYIISWMKNK